MTLVLGILLLFVLVPLNLWLYIDGAHLLINLIAAGFAAASGTYCLYVFFRYRI